MSTSPLKVVNSSSMIRNGSKGEYVIYSDGSSAFIPGVTTPIAVGTLASTIKNAQAVGPAGSNSVAPQQTSAPTPTPVAPTTTKTTTASTSSASAGVQPKVFNGVTYYPALAADGTQGWVQDTNPNMTGYTSPNSLNNLYQGYLNSLATAIPESAWHPVTPGMTTSGSFYPTMHNGQLMYQSVNPYAAGYNSAGMVAEAKQVAAQEAASKAASAAAGASLGQGFQNAIAKVVDPLAPYLPYITMAALLYMGITDPGLLSSAEAGTLTTEELASTGIDPTILADTIESDPSILNLSSEAPITAEVPAPVAPEAPITTATTPTTPTTTAPITEAPITTPVAPEPVVASTTTTAPITEAPMTAPVAEVPAPVAPEPVVASTTTTAPVTEASMTTPVAPEAPVVNPHTQVINVDYTPQGNYYQYADGNNYWEMNGKVIDLNTGEQLASLPTEPVASTNIASTGLSDSAPGTIYQGPNGPEIVLDSGKTVNLAEYQTAVESGQPVSVDNMMQTGGKVTIEPAPPEFSNVEPVRIDISGAPYTEGTAPPDFQPPEGFRLANEAETVSLSDAGGSATTLPNGDMAWLMPTTPVAPALVGELPEIVVTATKLGLTTQQVIALGGAAAAVAAVASMGAGGAAAAANAAIATPAPITPAPVTTPPVTTPPVEPVAPAPVTTPPVTTPPVTTPPVVEPVAPAPVTTPPVTTPPVTTPPVTTPPVEPVAPAPVTTPPVTTPPVVEPPVTTPPVTTPPVVEPPLSPVQPAPPVTNPPVTPVEAPVYDYSTPYEGPYSNESVLERYMSKTLTYGDIAKLVAAGLVAPTIFKMLGVTPETPTSGYGSTPLGPLHWGTATPLAQGGVNPGYLTFGGKPPDFYQTTNPAIQSQYYWGQHPYMKTMEDFANYNKIPGAPATPFGMQTLPQYMNVDQFTQQMISPQRQFAAQGTAPQYAGPFASATGYTGNFGTPVQPVQPTQFTTPYDQATIPPVA